MDLEKIFDDCLEEMDHELSSTQVRMNVPNSLDQLVDQYKEAYKEAFRIRRGVWKDGHRLMKKPEILVRMAILGLERFQAELGSFRKISQKADPTAVGNRLKSGKQVENE